MNVSTSTPGHPHVGEKEGILGISVTTYSGGNEVFEDASKALIEYCQQELNKNIYITEPNEFEGQGLAQGSPLVMKKLSQTFFSMEQAWYRRLTLPSPSSPTLPCPLSPGLFTGQYSAHGTEIVLVQLGMEGTYLRGIKITGDPNVPFNKVTFEVEDSRCLSIPQEDQASCQGVRDCQNWIGYEVKFERGHIS